jgi:hypothetical protein
MDCNQRQLRVDSTIEAPKTDFAMNLPEKMVTHDGLAATKSKAKLASGHHSR